MDTCIASLLYASSGVFEVNYDQLFDIHSLHRQKASLSCVGEDGYVNWIAMLYCSHSSCKGVNAFSSELRYDEHAIA